MAELHLEQWECALDKMREEFGDQHFDRWISLLSVRGVSDLEIELGAPNHFVLDWVRQRFMERMTGICRRVIGRDVMLNIVVDPQLYQNHRRQQEIYGLGRRRVDAPVAAASLQRCAAAVHAAASAPSVLAERFDETGAVPACDLSIESFVSGTSNGHAFGAALCVLENAGGLYNPLFVHGSTGVGKTHLLKGLYHAFRTGREIIRPGDGAGSDGGDAALPDGGQPRPRAPVEARYVTAEQFFNHFSASMQDRRPHKFRQQYRAFDVLIVDDIQQLATKKKTQIEFLHTFDALVHSGRQVVVSANAAPGQLTDLDPSLISRFLGGLVVRMDRPDYATRLKILQGRARRIGSRLSESVLELVAESLRGSGHELIGALMQLDVEARVSGRPLDIEAARRTLSERWLDQRRRITIEKVQECVARHYGLDPEILVSRSRDRDHSRARQVAMYLALRCTGLSLAAIGRYFGRRSHSTVKCSEKRIMKLLDSASSQLVQDVQAIHELLESD